MSSGDDPIRHLLQQIAASAGDPPEHGLEGLAARRRRRARHRRGAVATTVALAVLVVAVAPWLSELGDHEDVAAQSSGESGADRAQLPDVLTLRCTPDGIDVPVASIRPRRDGLHLVVQNSLTQGTQVWVQSEDWDSGRIEVARGRSSLQQPVPPGVLTVGCRVGNVDERRQVELVDVDHFYDEPELSCDEADQAELDDVPIDVPNPTSSYVGTVRRVLEARFDLDSDDNVLAYGAYPDESLGDVIHDPLVRVEQGDRIVAFVQLHEVPRDRDAGGPANRPLWGQVTKVEACRSFLESHAQPTATGG